MEEQRGWRLVGIDEGVFPFQLPHKSQGAFSFFLSFFLVLFCLAINS